MMKMSSNEIRTASNETLKLIASGLVREASDRMSRGIANDERERRGLIPRRF